MPKAFDPRELDPVAEHEEPHSWRRWWTSMLIVAVGLIGYNVYAAQVPRCNNTAVLQTVQKIVEDNAFLVTIDGNVRSVQQTSSQLSPSLRTCRARVQTTSRNFFGTGLIQGSLNLTYTIEWEDRKNNLFYVWVDIN